MMLLEMSVLHLRAELNQLKEKVEEIERTPTRSVCCLEVFKPIVENSSWFAGCSLAGAGLRGELTVGANEEIAREMMVLRACNLDRKSRADGYVRTVDCYAKQNRTEDMHRISAMFLLYSWQFDIGDPLVPIFDSLRRIAIDITSANGH